VLLINTYSGPRQYKSIDLSLDERLGTSMTRQKSLTSSGRSRSDDDWYRGLKEVQVATLYDTTRRHHCYIIRAEIL